ncbi:MAG: ribonuclease HI [Bacillota bacterium]|jgi:ribonuclease HI
MDNIKKKVAIYTDGACSGNPGPGGWAVILRAGTVEKELSGAAALTTNQRMELQAAIEGLKALKYPCRVELSSDSAYLINAFNQRWLQKWQGNGWRNSQGRPVENQDLWWELWQLAQIHQVKWIKVKGHRDHELNNRCDQLARAAVTRLKTAP